MDYNNQISEIKEALDIVQVVSKYVELKQAGKNFSGRCPFHQEKTPSFMVSPDIQRYKCFGCGVSGDIFNFVQEIENIDFPETLEKLAKMAGIELQKFQGNPTFKTIEEINYIATKYFYKELKRYKHAMEYVTSRGMNSDSIKNFGIGYAPKNPSLLKEVQMNKKYSKKELLDSGLFSEKEGVLKEKFRDRIMFPIRSKRGVVIGFTARILPGNDWGPKYMNSPETPIFHKKNNLFGQYESRQGIRKNDLAIICEGSTDVISAHQHEVQNIVAPLGTSITTEQLQTIATLTKNVLFFFDSDNAGKAALTRGFKLASELKMNPYATNASPYKDIDELLQSKPELFNKLIEEKKEAFSFILADFISDKNLNRLEDLNKTRDLAQHLLESVTDENVKAHYIEKLRDITKIELSHKDTPKAGTPKPLDRPRAFRVKSTKEMLQKRYLELLLIHPDLKEIDILPKEYFAEPILEEIYLIVSEKRNAESDIKVHDMLEGNTEIQSIYEDLIFNIKDIPAEREKLDVEIKKVGRKIQDEYMKEQLKDISVKIAMAEEMGDNDLSEKLLRELQEINKMLKQE